MLSGELSCPCDRSCYFSGVSIGGLNFCQVSWPRGYKTFFMLNSIEHENLDNHKYNNIKKFGFFKAQISLECYFSCS